MLVNVVRSQTSMYQEVFLSSNRIKLVCIRKGRYRVFQTGSAADGSSVDFDLGYVFSEGPYYIFVPHGRRCPASWFFGLTRCDAISGYLDSLKSTTYPEA